jgi:hypothetical protein
MLEVRKRSIEYVSHVCDTRICYVYGMQTTICSTHFECRVLPCLVPGSTIMDGIKDIENSDWTDTYLPKYQKKLLCNHPTAKGTNPTTGVDTRESLMCVD